MKHKFDKNCLPKKVIFLENKILLCILQYAKSFVSEITNFGIVGQDHSLKSAPKSSPSSTVCGRWILSVSGKNMEVIAPATLNDPITIRGKTLE